MSIVDNTVGAFGATASTDGQRVAHFQNAAGGATRTAGDVVVTSGATGMIATSSTTANDFLVIGVVGGDNLLSVDSSTYAVSTVMPVIVSGPARINIGSNTVAAGAALTTSTSAGVAQANTATTVLTAVGTIIGVSLEAQTAKDANNCIRAYIQKM